MSVTINDHRKYVAGKEADAVEQRRPEPLLEQTASDEATTGDEHLDKLVRGLQVVVNALELELTKTAHEGMLAVPPDMVRLCQMKYLHTKGKLDAIKEAMKVPAQIMVEARQGR